MKKAQKQTWFVFVLIAISVFIFSTCINNKKEKQTTSATKEIGAKTNSYTQFAGSAVCADCHKNISNSFEHTAHFTTSQTASQRSIKGSFAQR